MYVMYFYVLVRNQNEYEAKQIFRFATPRVNITDNGSTNERQGSAAAGASNNNHHRRSISAASAAAETACNTNNETIDSDISETPRAHTSSRNDSAEFPESLEVIEESDSENDYLLYQSLLIEKTLSSDCRSLILNCMACKEVFFNTELKNGFWGEVSSDKNFKEAFKKHTDSELHRRRLQELCIGADGHVDIDDHEQQNLEVKKEETSVTKNVVNEKTDEN
ncbi:hypothetical protein QAD02_009870 [Eretmocerus hayati]|uniref:Uncharacterized protein n=1 Tax=Eretmocerus hayati TaxID=131215 RepID=A0ACC2NAL7_9HYME|nr:hypothetical protein QAD02_009870 [Eretmocerus hayati]